jgi:hypothetical protein
MLANNGTSTRCWGFFVGVESWELREARFSDDRVHALRFQRNEMRSSESRMCTAVSEKPDAESLQRRSLMTEYMYSGHVLRLQRYDMLYQVPSLERRFSSDQQAVHVPRTCTASSEERDVRSSESSERVSGDLVYVSRACRSFQTKFAGWVKRRVWTFLSNICDLKRQYLYIEICDQVMYFLVGIQVIFSCGNFSDFYKLPNFVRLVWWDETRKLTLTLNELGVLVN